MKSSRTNLSRSLPFSRSSRGLLVLLLFAPPALAQTKAARATAVQTSAEQHTELQLRAARENPLQLRHFLLTMPKGADLHNHLSGAVYAESWIRAAVGDQLCVNLGKLSFSKPSAALASEGGAPACGGGAGPAANRYQDPRPSGRHGGWI